MREFFATMEFERFRSVERITGRVPVASELSHRKHITTPEQLTHNIPKAFGKPITNLTNNH